MKRVLGPPERGTPYPPELGQQIVNDIKDPEQDPKQKVALYGHRATFLRGMQFVFEELARNSSILDTPIARKMAQDIEEEVRIQAELTPCFLAAIHGLHPDHSGEFRKFLSDLQAYGISITPPPRK